MRNFLVFVALFSISSLLGGVLGNRGGELRDPEREALRDFTEILALVEDNYAEKTDPEQLVEGAIRGMLHNLDPHSNYLDPGTFTNMREEQRGSFAGLGIVVTKKGDLLTVISPIEGTPAYRMGIRAGDIISHIEGEPTETLALDEAVSRLKGKKGTKVTITVKRFGTEQPICMSIVRDDIPTKSITKAFMLERDIGYIKIKSFTRTTDDELEEALADLSRKGMKKLILDLRVNPGGLLDEAVQVTGRFLSPGQVVVATKGRTEESNHVFRDDERSSFFKEPLIVLVNRASASASEILAGAVQDHDRGLILGETTWGKGLVQSVYPLRYNAGLALTTARYYTPSGRCIQRDYQSWEDYYNPESIDEDPAEVGEQGDAFATDTKRPVHAGGGVRPDVILKPKPLSPLVEKLLEKDLFFKFSIQCTSEHPDLQPSFALSDSDIEEFRRLAVGNGVEWDAKTAQESLPDIKKRIVWQIAAAKLWTEMSYRLEAETDTVLQDSVGYFPRAEQLMRSAAAVVASRDRATETAEAPEGASAGRPAQNP